MTHTQTQGADGAGTKTAGIGPQTITTSRQTCNGCSALETKEWSFCGENDDLDSGTSARCAEANRGISSYWTVLNETPKWCPAPASSTPAPAATPGVPDSLRALSEAAMVAEKQCANPDDQLSAIEACVRHEKATKARFAFNASCAKWVSGLLASQPVKPGVPCSLRALSEAASAGPFSVSGVRKRYDERSCVIVDAPTCPGLFAFATADGREALAALADAKFFVAAANHVRALIAAQPAGQSEGRLSREREIVSTWDRDIAPGLDRLEAIARRMGAPVGTRLIHWAAEKLEEFGGRPAGQAGDAGASPVRAALEASMDARGANRQQAFFREAAARIAPAPNSIRTGAAETELRQASWRVKRAVNEIGTAPSEAQLIELSDGADALHLLLAARPEAPSDAGWRDISTAPKDGSKFDAWAVEPDTSARGVRFTDVQMRGDGSGFGVVIHRPDAHWEYLEQDGPTFPAWKLTHWRPLPTPPSDPAPSGQAEG